MKKDKYNISEKDFDIENTKVASMTDSTGLTMKMPLTESEKESYDSIVPGMSEIKKEKFSKKQ